MTLQLGDGLPEVNADRLLLHRLIYIATESALLCIAPGGNIRLETKADGQQVVFHLISDEQFIAEDDLELIYQDFELLGKRFRKPGPALALFHTRQIAELLRGRSDVDYSPEGGYCFTYTFPAAD